MVALTYSTIESPVGIVSGVSALLGSIASIAGEGSRNASKQQAIVFEIAKAKLSLEGFTADDFISN